MEIVIGVLVGVVILLVIAVLVMRPRAPNPDLIDLEEYAASVLTSVDRGSHPRPPDTTPGLAPQAYRQWTLEEERLMDNNRRVAWEIYEYAKRRRDES